MGTFQPTPGQNARPARPNSSQLTSSTDMLHTVAWTCAPRRPGPAQSAAAVSGSGWCAKSRRPKRVPFLWGSFDQFIPIQHLVWQIRASGPFLGRMLGMPVIPPVDGDVRLCSFKTLAPREWEKQTMSNPVNQKTPPEWHPNRRSHFWGTSPWFSTQPIPSGSLQVPAPAAWRFLETKWDVQWVAQRVYRHGTGRIRY